MMMVYPALAAFLLTQRLARSWKALRCLVRDPERCVRWVFSRLVFLYLPRGCDLLKMDLFGHLTADLRILLPFIHGSLALLRSALFGIGYLSLFTRSLVLCRRLESRRA